MCLMCIEILKGKMTIREGRTALKELIATADDQAQLAHYSELAALDDEQFQKKVEESSED
ncbi:MAG: hypothetical protein HN509_00460 [Halobacteriovoraceae bacterium]|jgi:hypothetical protein|nr:hypothetical protein [Halobacteriovoraceae bacterium]MBT5093316.1 hypothetical protein [Halobacteriovoraceae bacterium]